MMSDVMEVIIHNNVSTTLSTLNIHKTMPTTKKSSRKEIIDLRSDSAQEPVIDSLTQK